MIYANGKYTTDKDATVPVADRGFLWGDAVFSAVRTFNRRIFKLERAIAKLKAQTAELKITLPDFDLKEIVEKTYQKSLANGEITHEAWIRIIITRGMPEDGSISPPYRAGGCVPAVYVLVNDVDPTAISKEPLTLKSVARERVMPHTKNTNFLPSILACMEAESGGYDDAVLLDRCGHVTEATAANIFAVKSGIIYTPPERMYPGTTREDVIELAKKRNMPMEEKVFGLEFLLDADEVFLTSLSREITPVRRIDGRKIKESFGPVTRKMYHLYKAEKDSFSG